MADILLQAPFDKAALARLSAGDRVLLSGTIYTARDKAHERLTALIQAGKDLPVDLTGQGIYYAGPTPAKPGQVIGSVGPTTSGRMDAFSPLLLDEAGLLVMIGKGPRNQVVQDAMARHGAVYLVAVGGTGALIASAIEKVEVVAFEDLGTEAIRRLTVRDFPLIVAIDSQGHNLFETGPQQYAKNI